MTNIANPRFDDRRQQRARLAPVVLEGILRRGHVGRRELHEIIRLAQRNETTKLGVSGFIRHLEQAGQIERQPHSNPPTWCITEAFELASLARDPKESA